MNTCAFDDIVRDFRYVEDDIKALPGDYQPKNPFYAFQLMDKAIKENQTRPVCVILGQDPYPQKGAPTGIAFANSLEYVDKNGISPSLSVIKKSLKQMFFEDTGCLIYPKPFDTTLEHWIGQGILPINSALTVEPGKPGSHSLIWAKPMGEIITRITEEYPDLCWILLGSQAAVFRHFIPYTSLVLFDNHPSYYSRQGKDMPVRVWREAKEYCMEHFGKEIHWLG